MAKLDEAEALYAEAEAERALAGQERAEVERLARAQAKEAASLRAAAEEEAAEVKALAEKAAAQTVSEAEAVLTQAQREAGAMTRTLDEALQTFEAEKAVLAQRAAKEAAAVAVRLIAGVLTGDVGLKPAGAGWFIRDEALRDRAKALNIGSVLREVVSGVSELWDRLKGRAAAADLADEAQRASDLGQRFDPPPPGRQERYEP